MRLHRVENMRTHTPKRTDTRVHVHPMLVHPSSMHPPRLPHPCTGPEEGTTGTRNTSTSGERSNSGRLCGLSASPRADSPGMRRASSAGQLGALAGAGGGAGGASLPDSSASETPQAGRAAPEGSQVWGCIVLRTSRPPDSCMGCQVENVWGEWVWVRVCVRTCACQCMSCMPVCACAAW